MNIRGMSPAVCTMTVVRSGSGGGKVDGLARIKAILTFKGAAASPAEGAIETFLRIGLGEDQTVALINKMINKPRDLFHPEDINWAVAALSGVLDAAQGALKSADRVYSFLDRAAECYGRGGMGNETSIAFHNLRAYFVAAQEENMLPEHAHEIGMNFFKKANNVEDLINLAEALRALRESGYNADQKKTLLAAITEKTCVHNSCENLPAALTATAELDSHLTFDLLMHIIGEAKWFAGFAFASLPAVMKSARAARFAIGQIKDLYYINERKDGTDYSNYYQQFSSLASAIEVLHGKGLSPQQNIEIIRAILGVQGSGAWGSFSALSSFLEVAEKLRLTTPDQIHDALMRTINDGGSIRKFKQVFYINEQAELGLDLDKLIRLSKAFLLLPLV